MFRFSLRQCVVGLAVLLLASVLAPVDGGGRVGAQPANAFLAVDDVAWTTKSAAVLIDVLENDHDPQDLLDESTLTISSQPDKGTALVASDGGPVVRYQPSKAGLFSFGYEVCTSDGACDTATVTVYVGNSSCTIVGTNGNDVLEGTDGDDIICAKRGDDVVVANGGDDIVFGGKGNDVLIGGPGNDKLIGSKGADELDGGDGNDELRGGKGSDTLLGSLGSDLLIAGKGADVLHGGPGDDVLRARRGSDELFGGDGDDKLFGGRGADLLDGGPGNDLIRGKRGADTILGRSGNDELHGGKGPDVLEGEGGDDTIFGGRGDDRLDGGIGIDSLNGRAGNDSCLSGETNVKCELIQGSPGQPTNTVAIEPTTGATVTADTIGAADGLTIDVLAVLPDLGALSPIVDITLDNPGTLTSAIVTLPFDSSSNPTAPTMMYLDEEFGIWVPVDPIGQTIDAGTISATTNHFTYFTVLDFTSFRNTFNDVACSAAVDGTVGTYSEEITVSNPVAYWRFNDAPGPFVDLAGSHTLTGRFDAAADTSLIVSSTDSATKLSVNDFEQSGAIASSGQGPLTAINPDGFTVEFWVDLEASSSNSIIEFSGGASPFVFAIRTGGDGPVTEVIGRFGPDGDFSTNHYFDFLSGGRHVVVTFDGTNLSTWVDAVQIDSTVTAGALAVTPSVDTLELFGYNQSEMIVDEFAIYDRAIGDDEINRHFNAATSTTPPPPNTMLDSDLDGLFDCEETFLPDGQSLRSYSTNSAPGGADTDGDGYTDFEEVGSRIFPGEVYKQRLTTPQLELLAAIIAPDVNPAIAPEIRIWGDTYYYDIKSDPTSAAAAPPGSPTCWQQLNCTVTYIDALTLRNRIDWFDAAIVDAHGTNVGFVESGGLSWFANIDNVLAIATEHSFAEQEAFSLIDSFILQGVQDGLRANLMGKPPLRHADYGANKGATMWSIFMKAIQRGDADDDLKKRWGVAEQQSTIHGLEEAEAAGLTLPSGVHALLITIGNAYREMVARSSARENLKQNSCLLAGLASGGNFPPCPVLRTEIENAFDPRTPAAFGEIATVLLDEGTFQFTADGLVAWGIANLFLAGSSRTWPRDTGIEIFVILEEQYLDTLV